MIRKKKFNKLNEQKLQEGFLDGVRLQTEIAGYGCGQ